MPETYAKRAKLIQDITDDQIIDVTAIQETLLNAKQKPPADHLKEEVKQQANNTGRANGGFATLIREGINYKLICK